MRKLLLIAIVALLAAPLEGHTVVWLGDSTYPGFWPGNPDGKTPQDPMVLVYDADNFSRIILVAPSADEACVVAVDVEVIAGSSLISLSYGAAGNTAREVQIYVHALRAPLNGLEESAIVHGNWHATGFTGDGRKDPACSGADGFAANVLVRMSPTAAQQPCAACTADPISTSTGEVMKSEVDLALGGPLPLTFSRYYASMLNTTSTPSALGRNWMHNFEQTLSIFGNSATVVLYGAKVVKFQQSRGAWQLASNEMVNYQLLSLGGSYQFLDLLNDRIYTFSSSGVLTRIQDRNGNALTITPGPSGPASVSDGLGRTLAFAYNGAALASVTDQTGRGVLFAYTGQDLTAVTDPIGRITKYSYTTLGSKTSLMASETMPAGNKPVTHAFDASGRANRETDSLGNVTTVAYDTPSAGVTTSTDPLNAATRHTYQTPGNLAILTDAGGQNTAFSYDSANRVTSMTDRLAATTRIAYHVPSGFVSSITDAQGNTTAFTYTAQTQSGFTFYNRTKAAFADGTSTTYNYDAQGNATSVIDRGGKAWTYTYNARGQVLTTTNPAGGVSTYSYNNDGTMASMKTPAGDVTAYAYDDKKRPVTVQFPDKTSRSLSWDAADQLLLMTDERGRTMKLAYEPNGKLKSATDALNQVATFAYDTDDLISSSTDPLGKVTRSAYDAIGNITAVTNAAGEKTSYRYDALRRLISVADPAGMGPSFAYDAEGRVTGVTDALGNRAAFTRDKLGRVTRLTTPLGENFDLAYDTVDRLVSIANALGQTTTYAYDNRDLVTSLNLPGNIGASYTWGELPVLTSVTDPNGGVWNRAYDNLGRPIARTDPLGQTVSYTYDGRNRATQVTTPEGSLQISYDAAGNQTELQYSDGTAVTLTYDDDNRPTGGAGVTLGYDGAGRIVNSNGLLITRDDVGRIAAITYAPDKTVTYKYDIRGLLAQIADWTGGVTALAYDDAQRLISITRPNGLITRYGYDKNGTIVSIDEASQDQSLASITLQRDAVGKVISADRNLPQSPDPGPSGLLQLGYDAANQVAGASYDGLGRITSDTWRNYAWNLASELTAYSGVGGSASFGYDSFGVRTSATAADGTTQNYVLNYALPLPSIATVQSGGGDQRYYIYLPDGALLYAIEAADNSHHYYHFDEIGSTTFLTDDGGSVTDQYGVTPYGETVNASGNTVNPFTWLGKLGVMQEGSTGLYYMRFRYYDSTTARFLSRDPIPQLDPRAINPYQYAAANPMSLVDPMGLKGHAANAGVVSFLAPSEVVVDWFNDNVVHKMKLFNDVEDAIDSLGVIEKNLFGPGGSLLYGLSSSSNNAQQPIAPNPPANYEVPLPTPSPTPPPKPLPGEPGGGPIPKEYEEEIKTLPIRYRQYKYSQLPRVWQRTVRRRVYEKSPEGQREQRQWEREGERLERIMKIDDFPYCSAVRG